MKTNQLDPTRWQERASVPVGSEYRRAMTDLVANLGSPAAVILQASNAGVARSLVAHRRVLDETTERATRSLVLRLARVVGTDEQARQASRQINVIHRKVPRAFNRNLQRWLDTTLIYCHVEALRHYGTGMSETDAERAYADGERAIWMLGLPPHERAPTFADAKLLIEQQSSRLKVTEDSKMVADAFFHPRTRALKPFGPLIKHVVAELLPEPIGIQYGLVKGGHPRFDAFLQKSGSAVQSVIPDSVPERLARALVDRSLPGIVGPTRSHGFSGLD